VRGDCCVDGDGSALTREMIYGFGFEGICVAGGFEAAIISEDGSDG
jgi:hypothetical protein